MQPRDLFKGLELEEGINISIVKQISKDKKLIRFKNYREEKFTTPLTLFVGDAKVYQSNLNEELLSEIKTDNEGYISLELKDNQIKTIVIENK